MKRNLLLTPGPTQVPPEACEALGRPIIHHRTPQFQNELKQCIEGLKKIFQTQHDIYLLASSGTGAMEAAVTSLCSPGDSLITVEAGKFGERWREIAVAFGLKPLVLDIEWGKSVTPQEIEAALKKQPNTRAVFITLTETSTGATPDIAAIAKVVAKTAAVLVVDAVSGLGVVPLPMDEWGVDVVCSGSHKGLMLPPGVGLVAASPKAQAVIAKSTGPKYYFDLKSSKLAAEKTDTPFTPAIGIVRALNVTIQMILDEGMDQCFARYAKLAKATRAAAQAINLTVYGEEQFRTNSLTVLNVPAGVDGEKLVKEMRDGHGITMAGGQGHLKGKIVRMAHMGVIDEYDTLTGIAVLEKVLHKMGHKFELGAGLAAAQKVFN